MFVFGLSNGFRCFQQIANYFTRKKNTPVTFMYLDNVYVSSHNQEEHDQEENWPSMRLNVHTLFEGLGF